MKIKFLRYLTYGLLAVFIIIGIPLVKMNYIKRIVDI